MADIQKNLLQVLKHREQFEKYITMIDTSNLDKDTGTMLKDFNRFFKKNPDIDIITGDLYVAMKELNSEYIGDSAQDDKDMDIIMFREIDKEPDTNVAKSIVRHIINITYMASVEKTVVDYKLGNEPAPFIAVKNTQDKFKRSLGSGKEKGPLNMTLDEIFEEEDTGCVFKWRFSPLADSMANVRTGSYVIIGARPDSGKTSFIADQVTYMAQQSIGQTDRTVLWLNNEGKGSRIKTTAYRSALNLTTAELRALGGKNAEEAFNKYIGGTDRLVIYDIHGMHYTELENIIEDENPCIVIIDMIANVKGFEGEARTDLRLEQLSTWFRESAVIYDFLAIASSQVSADGEGDPWPDKGMLKDSKTGIQGACDGIIMVGMRNEPEYANTRYISCPKNKFDQLNGATKLCLASSHFDFTRAKYHNPVGHKDNPKNGAIMK